MKITSHTAGGCCPHSLAGTAIPDPPQLPQGADMHWGLGTGEVTACLPTLASWAQSALLSAPNASPGLFQSKLVQRERQSSCGSGSLSLSGSGEPDQPGDSMGAQGTGWAWHSWIWRRPSVCSFPVLGWEQEPVPLLAMVYGLWVRSFGEWQGLNVFGLLIYPGLGIGLS